MMTDSTPDPQAPACAVCGGADDNRLHGARDFLHGVAGEFTYLECGRCGCLQIVNKPDDLSPYYPADYYSYNASPAPEGSVKRRKFILRARHLAGNPSFASRVLFFFDALRRRNNVPASLDGPLKAGVGKHEAILDVGCGAGRHLLELADAGFQHLTGVDLFINDGLRYPNGVTIHKKSLFDLENVRFDFISLYDSFEHMDNPLAVLRRLRELLNPGKTVLIKMPVADGHGWRHYGIHWFPLEAPRHLMIHSRKSMEILAEEAGLALERVELENPAHLLFKSEARLRGGAHLDRATRKRLRALADELQRQGRGDYGGFYLKRP